MTRIGHAIEAPLMVVTRADFEADLQRGYTILEYAAAGEMVTRNPRNPSQEIVTKVPAMHMFRCMFCQWDCLDSEYTPEKKEGAPRQGIDMIRAHLFRKEHPWVYPRFENPYGNVMDVIIEGIEDYPSFLADREKESK